LQVSEFSTVLKRLFDIVASAVGLAMISPLMLFAAAAVRWSSAGPALFRQERVGRGGRPFFVLKFRTMVRDAPARGGPITVGDDPRITRVGRFLRKTKFDELPQLLNVLKGDMSLVGPRPEVRKYVEMFAQDYVEILRVRPGMTDLASIKYRDEAAVLAQAADPEQEYVRRVLPEKIQFARQYVRRQSLWLDLTIILGTLFRLIADRMPGDLSRKAKTL
jgi:lipopolysaccharide/colanic/teichoic acid biosynthesis glycosyltransferase